MRKHVDHMITLAKDGSLHARRQAMGYIYVLQLVHALFEQVLPSDDPLEALNPCCPSQI